MSGKELAQCANAAQSDDDPDAILAELEAEEDSDISHLRQQRLQELQASQVSSSMSDTALSSDASSPIRRGLVGTLRENPFSTLSSDEQVLRFTTEHSKALVHFYHPNFTRCEIMDQHLGIIASQHEEFGSDTPQAEVKFARVNVEEAEFVVKKLGIRVLPCVIGFIKGVVSGRVIGFEGLCWDGMERDQKVRWSLEQRFAEWGLVKKILTGQNGGEGSEDEVGGGQSQDKMEKAGLGGARRRGITAGSRRRTNKEGDDDDDDDDWD